MDSHVLDISIDVREVVTFFAPELGITLAFSCLSMASLLPI